MTSHWLRCLLLAGCVLAGCANERSAAPDAGAADENSASSDELRRAGVPAAAGDVGPVTGTRGGGEVSVGPGMQRLVDLARQDLAAKLGVEAAAIATVRAEYVTWRDSSLGCPRPGEAAMQVLTNGALIELAAGEQVYRYHSGRNRPPFLCKSPSPVDPLPYAPGEV